LVPLGGALADMFGLRAVMLGFLAFQVMEIVFLYMVPETGPRAARVAESRLPHLANPPPAPRRDRA
jgi:predicted MFS family arabinose efflux permease